jgi:hypothetical protein
MKILFGIVLGVIALSLARPYLRNIGHMHMPGGSAPEASGGIGVVSEKSIVLSWAVESSP